MIKYIFICFVLLQLSCLQAQNSGFIRGHVADQNTQESIAGALVSIEGTTLATLTDADGNYKLQTAVGTYNLKASYLGYTPILKFNIALSSGNDQIINFELISADTQLEAVTVKFDKGKSAVATDMVTPMSVQQLTTEEIRSNPGGNFDVSKVVQTLPGVGSSGGGAQRNDIIIRGGAPNENVYYMDGIEIPVLNHFQTQGSSGGAQGILNVSFIEDLKLSSSAFDARYDNALASTFVIKQREGNPEKYSGNARVSFTESAFTLEGPLKRNRSNFLMSVRKSYLDFLFTAIDLPIRPNFTDMQYKVTHKLSEKTTLTALGLGAIDVFSFAATKNETLENAYFRRSLPYINQWNYTVGFAVKHLIEKGFLNITASRNMFENRLDRFEDANDNDENFRNLKIQSQEMENKFRVDVNQFINGWKYAYGAMAQYVKYNTDLFNKLSSPYVDENNIPVPAVTLRFKSAIEFFKFGAFAQASKHIWNNRLLLSMGLRTDGNTFTKNGTNLAQTLSPRISLSYHLNPRWDINTSFGRYYKIPTYTALGYRDENGNFINSTLHYIGATHYVAGVQYLPNEALRFTLEGFFKQYNHYPVSISNGSSLANLGSDFGSIGSEALSSNGTGNTYGFEFFVQQKLIKRLFYVLSYTYVRSLYSGATTTLIPSAWDNRHLISGTLGYKFKNEWSIGVKYRFSGGNPYTPFDTLASQRNYAMLGTGVLDFSRQNTLFLPVFTQTDLRIDKKFNFKRISLDAYIDVQNVLLNKQVSPGYYTFKRNADNSGFETKDGKALKPDGSNAIPVFLENASTNVTPTLGFILEF